MRTKFSLLALLLGASLSLFTACTEADPCKDVQCGANGTCFEGACVCNEGFEGTACDKEWSAKFLGNYGGSDVCGGKTYNLTKEAVITRVDGTTINITNFGGFDSSIRAKVKRGSTTAATDLDLTFTDAGQRKFVGTATLTGTTIKGSYTVSYNDGTSDKCDFTYTKK